MRSIANPGLLNEGFAIEQRGTPAFDDPFGTGLRSYRAVARTCTARWSGSAGQRAWIKLLERGYRKDEDRSVLIPLENGKGTVEELRLSFMPTAAV